PFVFHPTMFRRVAILAMVPLLLAIAWGCRRPSSGSPTPEQDVPPWFVDITKEAGIDFVHDVGPVGKYFMPEIVGSGAALFDFDNDGRLDLYLLQNGGPGSRSTNRLYRQGADGRFLDVTRGSGLDIAERCMGVAIGDVNNDGWPDVFVTGYGKVWLLVNNGNGTFTDITREAGLDNPHWGTSASFVDYDRDGWLDLVVVNYVSYSPTNRCTDSTGHPEYCGPEAFPGTVSRLFHNRGPVTGGKPGVVRFDD